MMFFKGQNENKGQNFVLTILSVYWFLTLAECGIRLSNVTAHSQAMPLRAEVCIIAALVLTGF